MKKIIIYTALLVTVYSSVPHHADAIYCGNCKNVGQGMFDAIKETITAISTQSGVKLQTILTTNETVTKPLIAAMAASQVKQGGDIIQNLVASNLVSNPEVYLKNKGIGVTQGSIDAIAKQGGIFSDSIIGSLVSSAKIGNSSLNTQLAAINQSNLPNIAQNSICNDDASLSSYVKSNLSLLGGDYTAAKQNAYNSLCKGNPNTDPALAKKLVAINAANPTPDSLYDIAMGNNAYTKSVLANIAKEKAVNDAKLAGAEDLKQGGGSIKSVTTCKTKASNGLCIDETKTQSSSVLLASYNKSLGLGIDQALASEAGGLFKSLLPGLDLAKSLSSGLGGLLGEGLVTETLGNINDPRSPTAQVTQTTSQPTNTTSISTTGFGQDLVNNQTGKENLTGSMTDYLKQHLEALKSLEETEASYVATINSYNSQLASMKSCYDGIVTNNFGGTIPTPKDDRFNDAYNFYNTKKNANDVAMITITSNLGKIDETRALVNNTLEIITLSNSTDEITSTFKTYTTQIKSRGLPDINAGANEAGKQIELDGELQISGVEGGRLYGLNATCSTWKIQLQQQWNRSEGA